jgi:hypothetical protein
MYRCLVLTLLLSLCCRRTARRCCCCCYCCCSYSFLALYLLLGSNVLHNRLEYVNAVLSDFLPKYITKARIANTSVIRFFVALCHCIYADRCQYKRLNKRSQALSYTCTALNSPRYDADHNCSQRQVQISRAWPELNVLHRCVLLAMLVVLKNQRKSGESPASHLRAVCLSCSACSAV